MDVRKVTPVIRCRAGSQATGKIKEDIVRFKRERTINLNLSFETVLFNYSLFTCS